MSAAGNTKGGGLASGWILVTGLLLLCITGTGLTWWNYSRQVFSTADGVIYNQTGEVECAVVFPSRDARLIQSGHRATITVGEDKHPVPGRVIRQSPIPKGTLVVIRLVKPSADIANNARCSVTIDTTVPPQEEK